ncbi:MAG: hypothetical protein RL219_2417 [Actinomycetota bacterium]
MSPEPTPDSFTETLADRLRRNVERNVLRARNGLKHVSGVGRPEVGVSPRDLVWERGKVCLYRYRSASRVFSPPVLLVMSLVSKPYVLDLRPNNSFVEALVRRGHDVYMLDWGTPDASDARNTIETYCDELIPFASAAAMRTSGALGIHVFGYCLGGLLSLVFAGGHPEIPLRSLSLLATPIDMRHMGSIPKLLSQDSAKPEDFVDETGNVPAETVIRGVSSIAVTGKVAAYAALLENLDNSELLVAHQAMHGWANDHIPFPGATFRQVTEWLVKDNQLAENRLVTRSGPIDLSAIRCPVLNVMGERDHMVSAEANSPIGEHISHAETLTFPAGHAGLIIGARAHRTCIPAMAEWIEMHSDRI